MSYVPVFETVNSALRAVIVEELVLVVLCTTCVFLDVPETLTTNSARFVTSYVPFAVLVSLPLTSSLALTVTAVPVFVEPVIHPVVLVTDGVTETEWLLTVPFVADGVPAVPAATVAVA